MRRPLKARVNEEGCRCGSGSYCHKHRAYRLTTKMAPKSEMLLIETGIKRYQIRTGRGGVNMSEE